MVSLRGHQFESHQREDWFAKVIIEKRQIEVDETFSYKHENREDTS